MVEFEKVKLFETHKHGTVIMVYRPSFDPEACIALREKDGSHEYELNYTQANHNISFSMPDNGKKGQTIAIKIAKSVKPLDRDRSVSTTSGRECSGASATPRKDHVPGSPR